MSQHIAGRMRARAAEAGEAWRLTLAELLELPGRQSLPSVLLVSAALTVLPVAGAGAVAAVAA